MISISIFAKFYQLLSDMVKTSKNAAIISFAKYSFRVVFFLLWRHVRSLKLVFFSDLFIILAYKRKIFILRSKVGQKILFSFPYRKCDTYISEKLGLNLVCFLESGASTRQNSHLIQEIRCW